MKLIKRIYITLKCKIQCFFRPSVVNSKGNILSFSYYFKDGLTYTLKDPNGKVLKVVTAAKHEAFLSLNRRTRRGLTRKFPSKLKS
jgi:hypothetical protein